MMAAMDPQRLVDALRGRLVGDPPFALPDGAVALAARHRVDGTLYHIGVTLSEPERAAAEQAWTRSVAGHLARAAAFAQWWPDDAPPPLVIKGADLVENLYGDPGARAANDLDLLLPDAQYEAVVRRLSGARRPPPRHERYAHEPPVATGFEVDGVLIELHRAVAPMHRAMLSPRGLYERSAPGRFGRRAVRYPDPRDRLVIWLANAGKDAFFLDLAALLDLTLICRALRLLERPRWSELRADMGLFGLARPMDMALLRLAESGLWPAPLPPVPRETHLAARLLPPVLEGRVEPFQPAFQALKLWLLFPYGRRQTIYRIVAGLARRARRGR